jgi:hypothetical protein
MSLIYELRATFSNEIPTRFKPPEPDVLELIWYRLWEIGTTDLHLCGMYNRPTATQERGAALRPLA